MQPELIGGRYRVQRAIGQGGMGTVWLCRDEKLARDVAVKQVGLLPGESVTDSARALREARSSAASSHRSVVTVFDVVEEDGHIWMVMENVPSRSLSELIRDEGPLPPERVAAIGAQVAEGLASAHAAGITHRDVKPGNVLVREDGAAKISDFGIARTAGDPALTQSGLFIGTPTYFSPELARGAEPDPSADVWALGATLYAAVEGRPPFEQKTNAVAVISEIANQAPPPPRRAGSSSRCCGGCSTATRSPGGRWQTRRTRCAGSPTGTPSAPGPLRPRRSRGPAPRPSAPTCRPARPTSDPTQPGPAQPGPARRDRGRLLLALTAAALLLVGGIAFAAVTADDDPEASPEADAPTSASPSPSEANSPEQTSRPSGEASPAGQPTGSTAGARAFVRDYFGTVPADLDAGWGMLSPRMQARVGRGSYDGFWGTVSSVAASNLTRRGDSVDVTLRYRMDDGRVETERHRIGLVPDGDGGQLIDSDTVIG